MNQITLLTIVYLKKIYSTFLIKILFFGIIGISIGVLIYEDLKTSLSLFLFLSPYLFLFSTSDMVKDEIERGYLENRIFLIVSKEKIFYSKIIGILFFGISCVLIGYLVLSFFGIIKGENIFINKKIFISLLIGIYYVFIGLFLGFFLKGASNALFLLVIQLLSFVLIIKISPSFLSALEKGIFLNYFERINMFIILSLIPNLVFMESIKKYSYILLVNLGIIFFLTKYLLKKIEIKRV